MKKVLSIILISIILFMSFPIITSAKEMEFDFSDVLNEIDNQTEEYLDELGIDEISFENINNISLNDILKIILSIFFNNFRTVFKTILKLIATIIISSFFLSFVKEDSHNKNSVEFVSEIVMLLLFLSPIGHIVEKTSTVILATLNFVSAYIPVMFSLMIVSQNYGLAYTYNSTFLYLTTAITLFIEKVFTPLTSSLLTLNIISSFSTDKFNERLFKILKKIIVNILSFFSLIYSGFLTSKCLISVKADTVLIKGFRFISGRFIPIIGTGVSETLTQIFGSFSLLKTSFGFFVIIVILLMNLPIILELICWNIMLQFSSAFSDFLGMKKTTGILENFAEIFSLLNVIIIFITILHIVSTGIIILMGK